MEYERVIMETMSDYFYLSSLNTPADYLVFGALIMFVVGFVSFFYDPIQINYRSRYYFYMAMILFCIAVYLGWNDLDVIVKRVLDTL